MPFPVDGWFNLGNTKTQFVLVSRNQKGFELVGYRKEESTNVPSLENPRDGLVALVSCYYDHFTEIQ